MKLLFCILTVYFSVVLQTNAQITVTIEPQGTTSIKDLTGFSKSQASIVKLDICNGGEQATFNTERISSEIAMKEGYVVYDSNIVGEFLSLLQTRDKITKAQKIISAGGNVAILLAAFFKTINPATAALLSIQPGIPAIAAAILPAVGDPRDILALSKLIMPANTSIALGKLGTGNDCTSELVVVSNGIPKIDQIVLKMPLPTVTGVITGDKITFSVPAQIIAPLMNSIETTNK